MDKAPSTATKVQPAHKTRFPAPSHPLDPLTPDEIAAVCLVVRKHGAEKRGVKALKFITCYLLPAPKRQVLAHLGIPLAPNEASEKPTPIVRKAEVDFLDIVNGVSYNCILSLNTDGSWVVASFEKLADGIHPQISVEELIECEKIVRKDKKVLQIAKDIGIEPDQIRCDGWSIGYDARFPRNKRIQQAICFARFSEHDNLYAHPLDFVPIVDTNAGEVIHIDYPGVWKQDANGETKISTGTTVPPPLTEDAFAISNRDRVPPPQRSFDFLPDLMKETEPKGTFKLRDDVKPLNVVQPEGVSFKIDGNVLEWQKWKMHVAFSHREGIALSTITYNDNGVVRPVLYRMSVAEMTVPYGAPDHPHPRKFAFDTGEYGMGTMANELSRGNDENSNCDCLGAIHYLPGAYVAHDGQAVVINNVICIHEEDAGVLWKHTDYRPNGRGHTVRSRRLVISMSCTLANYEYVWNYHFYQDGSCELEILLTGIVQAYVHNEGDGSPYGTVVAPGINAHYHQHMFCVRLDTMVDGLTNSVVEHDIVPLKAAPGSAENYAGNGFAVQNTVLKKASEGSRTWDFSKDRRWTIANTARKHYASGLPASYAIGVKGGATPMMVNADGWVGTRAAFMKNTLWVCKDVETEQGNRMWPAGKFVPGTRDPKDSIEAWTQGDENIENEDLIVWAVIGTTHIPRPEDWPVMPVDHLRLTLKPQNFFAVNPAMDVPATVNSSSVEAFPNGNSCCQN